MRISRNSESGGRPLSTADLASAGRRSDARTDAGEPSAEEQLRTSQAEGDIETPRTDTDLGAPDRPPVRATRSREEARSRAEARSSEEGRSREEALVALFTPELMESYRSKWTSIQSSFVDDPKQAVRSGDELVAQVMSNLANSFAEERHKVEAQLDETGEGSTENLRIAFRRYRSFFERLLSL